MRINLTDGQIEESKDIGDLQVVPAVIKKFAQRDVSIKRVEFTITGSAKISHEVSEADLT